jgi:hypothetical protein
MKQPFDHCSEPPFRSLIQRLISLHSCVLRLDRKLIIRGFQFDTVSCVCDSDYLVSAVEPYFERGFKFATFFSARVNKQEPYPSSEDQLQALHES